MFEIVGVYLKNCKEFMKPMVFEKKAIINVAFALDLLIASENWDNFQLFTTFLNGTRSNVQMNDTNDTSVDLAHAKKSP